jgi:hypothetical protein
MRSTPKARPDGDYTPINDGIPVQMRLVISGARGSFRRLQTERREEKG